MARNLHLGAFVLIASLLAVSQMSGDNSKNGGNASVEQTLKQMENDWGDAVGKKDTAALDKILADDWVGQYSYGPKTKAQILADLKSGNLKAELPQTSAEMKVRLFGDTAIVTGGDDFKGSYKGKDISGHEIWTDIFVKRNGRWQAVASQNTTVTIQP